MTDSGGSGAGQQSDGPQGGFCMFQDLDVSFDNAFRHASPQKDSTALLYRGDAVLARTEDGALRRAPGRRAATSSSASSSSSRPS